MSGQRVEIAPFSMDRLDEVVAMGMRAWSPVFPLMRAEIPAYVYESFYPEGWEARQRHDIEALCRDGTASVFVASLSQDIVCFVGLREHREDRMGEIHIIAVDPRFQRRGVGKALMDFAFEWMAARDLSMAMVETGGDSGHAPSRAAYEAVGFELYPVARYFKKL